MREEKTEPLIHECRYCEDCKKIKNDCLAILELIESEQHPAARVIYDFVTGLIAHYDYSLSKELDKMGNDYFKAVDEKAVPPCH